MNIIGRRKTFKDVKVGDKVYMLDPKDQSILELTVTGSFLHPKSNTRQVWALETFIPTRYKSLTDEAMKDAQGFGTKTTQTYYLDKDLDMAILQTEVPTVLATEKSYIQLWMLRR